ncbi:MAG: GNAT family N-acetyltransferase [Lentisphaerae bacterium]|nr:GNAT family N-acetyltransferase [Lentisphaerota bacterium]
MLETEPVNSAEQIAAVERLAREIWVEHHTPIIGREQVDYMLARFQSAAAIARQIADGHEYYILVRAGAAAGYLAIVPDHVDGALMLSKIYVRHALRGAGIGCAALDFVEKLCRARHLHKIWLMVNRHNITSIAWYERMGFVKVKPIIQDIGGGYLTDDFRMEKRVSKNIE